MYSSSKWVGLEDMLGKTLTACVNTGERITFEAEDGSCYVMDHSLDCCESVYIESIVGDLSDLVGTPLLLSEEVSGEEPYVGSDSYTLPITANLSTAKGPEMSKRANDVVAKEVADKGFYLEGVRRSEVATKVRMKMKAQGLLLRDLAERLDVSSASVSRMLGGRQNLTLDALYRLADAVECHLQFEFGKDDGYQAANSLMSDPDDQMGRAGNAFNLDFL